MPFVLVDFWPYLWSVLIGTRNIRHFLTTLLITNLKYLTSSLDLSTLYIKAAPSSQQHGEYWRWAKLTTAARPRRHHGLLLLLLLQVGKQQEGASAAVALLVLLHLDVYYYIDIDDDVVGSSSSRREGELYTYLLISQGATEYSLGRNGGDRL